MQNSLFGLVAASLLLASTAPAAMAQTKPAVEAKLATPLSAPKKLIIDGRLWRCADDTCVGQEQGDSQALKRECSCVAKAVGPLLAYRNGVREVAAADLAECNKA